MTFDTWLIGGFLFALCTHQVCKIADRTHPNCAPVSFGPVGFVVVMITWIPCGAIFFPVYGGTLVELLCGET